MKYEPNAYLSIVQSSTSREIDCFTITLGQKTGTTFPIDIHNQKVYALYDTGASCSLINYSMYETLGTDLDKGYMPHVRSSTREDMGALGQVTYTFKINGTSFTQSFIVCRNMNRHMILGTDFTATNFVGVILTCEGTQKLMYSNGKTIMELQDTTAGIPLAMAYSVKIESGGHRTVPLECSSQLEDQMDIRVDAGFHHRNPNVCISPSCINNPGNEFHSQFIPLIIFNLSKVDHLYIGRDTVAAFADKPAVDVYHVEIASDEKIKEHLPSQGIGCYSITKHYQKYLVTPLLYVPLQMYQATARFISRTRKSRRTFTRGLKSCVKSMVKHSPNTMKTSAEPSLSRWI